MKIRNLLLMTMLSMLASINLSAQTDSLVTTNGNVMVGEIKEMKQGVLQIETDYSDSDFKVEWDKIARIKSSQDFIITLSKGFRYTGSIKTAPADQGKILISDIKNGEVVVDKSDLVFLKSVDRTFLSRLSLMMSVGYTLTKANNMSQLSGLLNAGYLSTAFGVNAYVNAVRSFQAVNDTINTSTKRTEAGIGGQVFVVRDWFAMIKSDFLQSTEQKLTLRAITKGGIGNYIINSQVHYLFISGGAAWNFENFEAPDITDRNSFEAYLGTEYNLFDFGDLDVNTTVYAYPGITEKGRFRTDFNLNIKYDFPLDFFINLGFTLNYDNKPVQGASSTDYVLQTTVGWEL